MQRYNMDGTQPDNRVTDAANLRFNNTQSSAATNGKSLETDRHQLLYNVNASTSSGAQPQRFGNQHCHHPSGLPNNQSDSNSYYANNMLHSQTSFAYPNTSRNLDPTNQKHDIWYGNATSNSSQQNVCNASSSYNEMHGYAYATGSSTTLADHLINTQSSSMAVPKSTQCSKQLHQHQLNSQDYSQCQNYSQQSHQTQAQPAHQSYSTQQMNHGQSQQLMNPNQSNVWNLSLSQPLLQTNSPTKDLIHVQGQQTYKLDQHQFNHVNSTRKLLSRKNHDTRSSHKDQAELSQIQSFDQNLTQPWNQHTSNDMHLNKYQRMRRNQIQQWQQQHIDRMYQLQTIQQSQTEQQQPMQQNCWTQSTNQCQPQQPQQIQTAQEQNWGTPHHKCLPQKIYQSPNQQLETGLTPVLKDLRFPSTQALRFSDSQNQLETNLTPILKDNICNEGRHHRVHQFNSSTPKAGAQKELFQPSQRTWSNGCSNLQDSFVDDGTNNLGRSTLWNGEQKKNSPVCQDDKILMVRFDGSNNKLIFSHASKNQEPEINKTLSEFIMGAGIAAASNLSSSLQQPSAKLNSGLIIQNLLSTGQQADDQKILDTSVASASCNNEPRVPKIHKKNYTCEICGDVLKFRSTYRAHHLRHLDPTKHFGCTICDSKFSDRSSLRKHLRVHTGEQPFECTTCGSRFSQAGNLRRHERLAHSSIGK